MKRNEKVRVAASITFCFMFAVVVLFLIVGIKERRAVEMEEEKYLQGFEYGEKIWACYLNVESYLLLGEISEKQMDEYREIHYKLLNEYLEDPYKFQAGMRKLNEQIKETLGEEHCIEIKTISDMQGFSDAAMLYWNFDMASLKFMYGDISEEAYKKIEEEALEVRENISHDKVIEFARNAQTWMYQ